MSTARTCLRLALRLGSLGAVLLAGPVGLAGAPSDAQADVVRTASGLTLEGAASRQPDGSLTLQTEAGPVHLKASDVLEVKPGDGPRTLWRREAAQAPGTRTAPITRSA